MAKRRKDQGEREFATEVYVDNGSDVKHLHRVLGWLLRNRIKATQQFPVSERLLIKVYFEEVRKVDIEKGDNGGNS